MNVTMDDVKNVPTPALDRQRGVIDDGSAGVIEGFIDWLAGQFDEEGRLEVAITRGTRPCTFMDTQHYVRCVGGEVLDDDGGVTCTWCWRCQGTGRRPKTHIIQDFASDQDCEAVMAKFFGIDLEACERERQAILEAIRS